MIQILFTQKMDPRSTDPIDENPFGFITSILQYEEIIFTCNEDSPDEPQRQTKLDIIYKDLAFDLIIEKKTVNNTRSILFDLATKDCTIDIRDTRITELKLLFKSWFLGPTSLGECYWIYDEQSLQYSQDLYSGINKAENLFRSYIVSYMSLTYGIGWWEKVAQPIQKKHSGRIDGYQNSLTGLSGINVDLFSIDTRDLTALIQNDYLINIEFVCSSKEDITTNNTKLRQLVKSHLKNVDAIKYSVKSNSKGNFWDELSRHFSNPSIFKEKWDRLCENRNHIMHNKLIDYNMFNIINTDNNYIIQELKEVIRKVRTSVRTIEDHEFACHVYSTTRDSDLRNHGYHIFSIEDIQNYYQEYILEYILEPAEILLYFHSNSIIENQVDKDFDFTPGSTLIGATNGNTTFEFEIIDSAFDDAEGSESYVTFQLTNSGSIRTLVLYFRNLEVEIDNDTKEYLPVSEAGFNNNDFFDQDIIEELADFLKK